MFPYNKIKALHSFKPVRVLSGKDLYQRYGQRVPVDKEDFAGYSRNPLERMDYAMDKAKMSFEDYQRIMSELQQEQPAPEVQPSTDSGE